MSKNGVHDPSVLQFETVWLEANRFQEAEERYEEHMAVKMNSGTSLVQGPRAAPERQATSVPQVQDHTQSLDKGISCKALPSTSLACEIANARQKIQNFMKSVEQGNDLDHTGPIMDRMQIIEEEHRAMKENLDQLRSQMQEMCQKFNSFITKFESSIPNKSHLPELSSAANHVDSSVNNGADEDDGVDLFGSDEETEEDRRVKEERLKAYQNKKAKKPALVAKSSVVLDVKPWDDETNMQEVETAVRKIETDGLKWGAGKLVPLAYGIKKLQIVAIVEDDKVSVDWLQESIEAVAELVQSVDIAAFNKL